MSTIDSAFNNDETRRGRFLTWVGHKALWAIAAMAIIRALGYFDIQSWLTIVADMTAFAMFIIAIWHNQLARLCLKCMEEVPADAAVRAQRQQGLLWISHSLDSGRRFLAWGGVIVAVSVFASIAHLPRAIFIPIDVYWLLYLYSTWLHHRLRPWCPYCRRWDDGGMHEPSPDPVVKATR